MSIKKDLRKIACEYGGSVSDEHDTIFQFENNTGDYLLETVLAAWECFELLIGKNQDLAGFQVYLTSGSDTGDIDLGSLSKTMYSFTEENLFWIDSLLINEKVHKFFHIEEIQDNFFIKDKYRDTEVPGFTSFLQKYVDFEDILQNLIQTKPDNPVLYLSDTSFYLDEFLVFHLVLERENIPHMYLDFTEGKSGPEAFLSRSVYSETELSGFLNDSEIALWNGGYPILDLLDVSVRNQAPQQEYDERQLYEQFFLYLKLTGRSKRQEGHRFFILMRVDETVTELLKGYMEAFTAELKQEPLNLVLCIQSAGSEAEERIGFDRSIIPSLWSNHPAFSPLNSRKKQYLRDFSDRSFQYFYCFYRTLHNFGSDWIRKNMKDQTFFDYLAAHQSDDFCYCFFIHNISGQISHENLTGLYLSDWDRERLNSAEKDLSDWGLHHNRECEALFMNSLRKKYSNSWQEWARGLADWLCVHYVKLQVSSWDNIIRFLFLHSSVKLLGFHFFHIWERFLYQRSSDEILGFLGALEKLTVHENPSRKDVLGQYLQYAYDRFLALGGTHEQIQTFFLRNPDSQESERNFLTDLHLLQKGKIYYSLGIAENAASIFEHLPDNFLRYGYHKQVGDARIETALLQISQGNYRKGVEILEVARKVSFQVDDVKNQCRALAFQALGLMLSSYMSRSLRKTEETQKLAESAGLVSWSLYALFIKARIYFVLGKYAESDTCFRQGDNMARRFHYEESRTVFRNWGARVLSHLKRPEAALTQMALLPDTREIRFFRAEAMIMSRKWREALNELTWLKRNPPSGRGLFLSESPSWKDGFYSIEDRYHIASQNTLEALISGFYWFLQAHNNDKDALNELKILSEKYNLPVLQYFYYLVYPKNETEQKQKILLGILNNINISVGQIVNPGFKKSFLHDNYWHSRIMQTARKNGLL